MTILKLLYSEPSAYNCTLPSRYCSASEVCHPSEVCQVHFFDNIKEFLLSSYNIYVYRAVERSYSIYLNVNIACP